MPGLGGAARTASCGEDRGGLFWGQSQGTHCSIQLRRGLCSSGEESCLFSLLPFLTNLGPHPAEPQQGSSRANGERCWRCPGTAREGDEVPVGGSLGRKTHQVPTRQGNLRGSSPLSSPLYSSVSLHRAEPRSAVKYTVPMAASSGSQPNKSRAMITLY